jgi:hypothetical protein
MKRLHRIYKSCKKSYTLLLPVFLSVLFFSCDSYNFTEAQPGDKENIYEFPEYFLGSWLIKGEGINHYYVVNKKNVLVITHDKSKIVKGTWPKPNEKGDTLMPPWPFNPFTTIIYDSLRKRIDTINNYVLSKNKIYKVNDERFLEKGYSYQTDKDTIIVFEIDTIFIDLGQNAFLRQLNKNFYVLNIRNSILGVDGADVSDWWWVMVLEIKEDKTLNIWQCTNKSYEFPCMFYDRPSKSDIFYFDCEWTTADMLRLIKEGYFAVSSKLYRGE